MTTNSDQHASVVYLSHGGGPLPLLGDPGHREMVDLLTQLPQRLIQPSAIVVVSAHWEEARPTITAADSPELIYDYYGFPEESYKITYPAPGEPALAERIAAACRQQGFDPLLTHTRGFDHGLFVPLKILYPEADIPCVQVSLLQGLDARAHVQLGKALRELRDDNVLLVGSGFSFHNMRAFFAPASAEDAARNAAFEDWLVDTCGNASLEEAERERRLIDWQAAPAARYCHPREEHLLPMHVCYGATGTAAREVLRLHLLGKQASMYLW